MTRNTLVLLTLLAFGAAFIAAPARAGDLDLTWNTVDGGGGDSSGGGFEVAGTIGQHDASDELAGGGWSVNGGFWAAGGAPAAPCPADVDGSGAVDFGDLVSLLANWGTCPGCPEDFDESGSVDFADLVTLLATWGPCP